MFSLAERHLLIEQSVADLGNVEVDAFEGLLVKYVEKQKGNAVIRGLRAVSDFEFEFQMALMNRKLNEKVETLFMMPRASYSFLKLDPRQGDCRAGRGRLGVRYAGAQALQDKLGQTAVRNRPEAIPLLQVKTKRLLQLESLARFSFSQWKTPAVRLGLLWTTLSNQLV